MEDGRIPDSAITAGPTRKYYPVNEVRPHKTNTRGWCAENKEDGSWVQIDLGKVFYCIVAINLHEDKFLCSRGFTFVMRKVCEIKSSNSTCMYCCFSGFLFLRCFCKICMIRRLWYKFKFPRNFILG